MSECDFEKYADQHPMSGSVSEKYIDFFKGNIKPFLIRDSKILDFGCGDGKYFDFFAQFTDSNNIFGVEISKTRVERCKKIGWMNVFKINSLAPLPFPNSFFNLISCDQVIEHIKSSDIHFYLKELNRIIAENGQLIIVTPNYPIKRIYDLYSALSKKNIKRLRDDPTHVAKYNFKNLQSLFSPYFKIIKLEPSGGFIWEKFRYDVFSHKIIGLLQKDSQDQYGYK